MHDTEQSTEQSFKLWLLPMQSYMHGSTQLKASELAKSSEKGTTELSESPGVD